MLFTTIADVMAKRVFVFILFLFWVLFFPQIVVKFFPVEFFRHIFRKYGQEVLRVSFSNLHSSNYLLAGRQPTYLISTQSTLLDAVHHFAISGIQRVMIVDRPIEQGIVVEQTKPEEMVVGLLTQSDLVRFVAENFMWMKREPIFQKTLAELNLGNRKPVTVEQNVHAYQAFLEIHKNGREGVAMVDANGKLISNVSASNIKGMTRRNYQLLFRPLTQYLARDRKRGWWQLPICTTLDTKLEHVVLQFVAAKIHRMYICDEEGRPTGEVSLTDVMSQLRDL